jgi:hypothetical protein
VHPSILLATFQAAALTVAPGPSDSCPSSAQVQAALEAHASALVTPRLDDEPAKMLTLTLLPPPASGETSFSLIDKAGLVKLYRSLPAPAADRTRDCAALADTVAFIVLRYFEEVEMPALPERKPPPPPPETPPPPPKPTPPAVKPPAPPDPVASPTKDSVKPPDTNKPDGNKDDDKAEPDKPSETVDPATFALSGNGGRRFPGGAEDFGGYEAKLTMGWLLSESPKTNIDLWFDVSGGFAGRATMTVPDRPDYQATSTRWSAELALLAGVRVEHSRLYVGPVAALDAIFVDSNLAGHTESNRRFPVAAGFKAGYQHFWASRIFVRADLTTNVAIVRERVATQRESLTFFEAPRVYATLSLGLGVWF